MVLNELLERVNRLPADKRAAVMGLVGRIKHRWLTLPGPQHEAYHCLADELFYGGAAGSAKSDLLLGLSRNEHRRSIIFRRTYGQLSGIIERAFEMIPARLNSKRMIYRLPDTRTIELGAVQHETDWKNFAGRPHDLIGFDEIQQFLEFQYRRLIAWNRHPDPRQRKRVVATGNPPEDQTGEWVIRYWGPWLDPGNRLFGKVKFGELVWFTTLNGEDVVCENGEPFLHHGRRIQPRSRTFIPGRLRDNPYLMLSGYESVLQALPEPFRSQLLDGDFMASKKDDARQVIPSAWVDAAMERWRKAPQPDHPVTAVGVDVARGGRDNTVLTPRRGSWFAEQIIVPGHETPDGPSVAMLVTFHVNPQTQVNIDSIGVGSSAVDYSRDKHSPDMVFALNASEATHELDRTGRWQFKNCRSMWYWRMREFLDPAHGDPEAALPPSPNLKADLCAARFRFRGSRIEVESKDEIKLRIGRSPDEGDSAIYALVYHYTEVAVALGGAFR